MINVARKQDKLIWQEDADIAPDTEVFVTEQCQALVIGDGAVADILSAGKNPSPNPMVETGKKKFFRKIKKPLYGRCDILGVDTSKEVVIPWGVGEVKFRDEARKFNGELKACGSCTVAIRDGRKLYRRFFDRQTSVDDKFLIGKLRPELCALIKNIFQETADTLQDISKIRSENISKKIDEKLFDELSGGYGLKIKRISYEITGDGLEELLALENKQATTIIETEIAKSAGEGMKAIAGGVNAFNQKPAERETGKDNIIKLKNKEDK